MVEGLVGKIMRKTYMSKDSGGIVSHSWCDFLYYRLCD
jgi:hypothetical protein